MELHPLPILVFLFLFMVASQAALPSENYWNSMLPNTSMPQAIKKILRPDAGGVSFSMHKGAHIVPDDREKYGKWYDKEGGFNEIASHLYLLEKDMIPGTQMNLHFKKSRNTAAFLPREVVDSIPFSSNKFPEILKILSVKPESIEAEIITKIVKDCEEPANKGEDKLCATSLESMVDFSILELGKQARAFSTEVQKKDDKMQLYTFMSGVKKLGSSKSVVCHDMNYAYAVFYCHEVPATGAYIVPLVGADGSKAKAVAVCHEDTSTWNPNHLAFHVLKVKPGSVPICHFIVEETVLWVGN